MKNTLIILPLLLFVSCNQPIPDGAYRLINWNGQTEYLPEQYYTFEGNDFGAFVIDDHGEHGDKIEYGIKSIEYQSNDVFTFKRNDTIYGWNYSLRGDTLTLKSQNIDMYIVCLKEDHTPHSSHH